MFADIRTEWRVNDIERSLQEKANQHELTQTNRDVDGLERKVRDLESLVDGFRHQLQAYQEEIQRLNETLQSRE